MQQHTVQYKEIAKCLEVSTCGHLVECLFMVPDNTLDAIGRLIDSERGKGRPWVVIRDKVVHDVAALVEGSNATLHCQEHILPVETYDVCQQCGNDSRVLNKIQAPGVDLHYVCNDCLRDMSPSFGNTL